jgi:hypothetical protein
MDFCPTHRINAKCRFGTSGVLSLYVLSSIFLGPSKTFAGPTDKNQIARTTAMQELCDFRKLFNDPLQELGKRYEAPTDRDDAMFHFAPRTAVLVGHSLRFLLDTEGFADLEKSWARNRPLGVHPLTSTLAPANLTPDEKARLKNAAKAPYLRMAQAMNSDDPMRSVEGQATATFDIPAQILILEAEFLRETNKRIIGLQEANEHAERTGKKLQRVAERNAEIEHLKKHSEELETAVLAKYAEMLDVVASGVALPKDTKFKIARAAYDAAHNRAIRLGLKFREGTMDVLGVKAPALFFDIDDSTEVGRLARKLAAITSHGSKGEPMQLVFSPKITMDAGTGNTYVDHLGHFNLSAEYLLFGKDDVLVTPQQLRLAQLATLQNKNAPSPFRGVVQPHGGYPITFDAAASTGEVVIRGILKMLPTADEQRKRYLALRSAEDASGGLYAIQRVRGIAPQFQEITTSLINRLRDKPEAEAWKVGIQSETKDPFLMTVPMPTETTFAGLKFAKMDNGTEFLQIDTGAALVQFPITGRDIAPIAKALKQHMHAAPDGVLTKEAREDIVRLMRILQRSTDIADGLVEQLIEPLRRINDTAVRFAMNPTPEHEAAWTDALRGYQQSKIDRLTMRRPTKQTASEEPAEPGAAVGIRGAPTPQHLVNRLKAAQGKGKQTADYRSAMEEIGVEAVRVAIEEHGFITYNRGPDQEGYDVKVADLARKKEMFLEVKTVSDPQGIVTFTPNEIAFANAHKDNNDWVLAIVTVDAHGQSEIHFRRGADLGANVPKGSAGRPFLVQDLLNQGTVLQTIEAVANDGRNEATPSPKGSAPRLDLR